MIRRPFADLWLIIDQTAHAELAAELAKCSKCEVLKCWPHREKLIETLRHHDDGWIARDRLPLVDSRTGIPRDFTEMPLHESTRIWKQSIERCHAIAESSSRWVGGHFRHLADYAMNHRVDAQDVEAAKSFLLDGADFHMPDDAMQAGIDEAGVRWLQFFDRMSLLLCCVTEAGDRILHTPQSTDVTLRFQNSGGRVEFSGWNFEPPTFDMSVIALRIPRRKYRDESDLAEELHRADSIRVRWEVAGDGS